MIRLIWEKVMKWGWDYNRNLRIYPVEKEVLVSGSQSVDVEGLSFNVMPAQGGTIVQIRHQYDHKNDKQKIITHVIPEGEDIAERVGQIVSMEILRA